MKGLTKKEFGIAFRSTIPVMTGYLTLGIGFGILLGTKGYGAWWALGMSGAIYAGSMQFVAVDLLSGGASLLSVALTTLMVNARHLFYGISMLEKYKGTGLRKPYLLFSLTDETYSLVCAQLPPGITHRFDYYFTVSLLDHIYWMLGSVLGSLFGAVIPFRTEGIDFALTALFLTIFLEQWLSTKDHIYAVIGVLSTFFCRLVFGSENFLIPSMLLITLALTVLRKTHKGGAAA